MPRNYLPIFLVSILTNFVVNQVFGVLYFIVTPLWFLMLLCEIGVLLSEFFLLGICSMAIKSPGMRKVAANPKLNPARLGMR